MLMCEFANPPPSMVAELIHTVTGIPCDIEIIKVLAERIYMTKRLFSLKMGITAADDKLPQILLTPKDQSESAGKTPNFKQLKEAYYKYRTFDLKTGKPSPEKLKKLGLDKL